MADIVIADLGAGNLHSVQRAAEHVGGGRAVTVSATPSVISAAEHLILPGQGAIGAWVKQLGDDVALRDAVTARLNDGPALGICLGLQALYAFSEESGGTDGLGLFDGAVRHFNSRVNGDGDGDDGDGDGHDDDGDAVKKKLAVPHTGWNRVRHTAPHPLWHGIDDGVRFYFVHSYFVDSDGGEVAGATDYGGVFASASARENLFAVQFHPEKSQRDGLQLLKNFVNWNGVN